MIEKLVSYNSSYTSIDGVHWESHPNLEDVINKINEIIDAGNTPTVDTGPIKHGHWSTDKMAYTNDNKAWCSACKKQYNLNDLYNIGEDKCFLPDYCPHCGAKMNRSLFLCN